MVGCCMARWRELDHTTDTVIRDVRIRIKGRQFVAPYSTSSLLLDQQVVEQLHMAVAKLVLMLIKRRERAKWRIEVLEGDVLKMRGMFCAGWSLGVTRSHKFINNVTGSVGRTLFLPHVVDRQQQHLIQRPTRTTTKSRQASKSAWKPLPCWD
jgi:hypothetical protein